MYVILVHDDNTLSAPKKSRIMQRSKLVDKLIFMSHPMYNDVDLTNATVTMEYVLPISRSYKTEILVKSKEMYQDHLVYELPVDTELTVEAGEIELQLTFTYVDIDADGKVIQQSRKTDGIFVKIHPISVWSDIIPDSSLSAIDQRIIKQDAQIKALDELANQIYNASKSEE